LLDHVVRHPDKNPGCQECPAKYIEIAEAHKQIVDFEKGVLKLRNKREPQAQAQEQQQQQQEQRQRRHR